MIGFDPNCCSLNKKQKLEDLNMARNKYISYDLTCLHMIINVECKNLINIRRKISTDIPPRGNFEDSKFDRILYTVITLVPWLATTITFKKIATCPGFKGHYGEYAEVNGARG